MTDEQFCLIHTEFTGEKTTSIKQIVLESFSGEELKEYVELHMKYRDALPKQKCIVCNRERPEAEMRNVDTLDQTAEAEWIYACDDINPDGLGGTCYGKYNREFHLKKEDNLIVENTKSVCIKCASPMKNAEHFGFDVCTNEKCF